jgi:hypothetical protein
VFKNKTRVLCTKTGSTKGRRRMVEIEMNVSSQAPCWGIMESTGEGSWFCRRRLLLLDIEAKKIRACIVEENFQGI